MSTFQCANFVAFVPAVKEEESSTSYVHRSEPPPSSFMHALQTTAWLPSSLGGVQPPSALFYPDSQILALLGEHVSYLACPVKDPNFLTALGITMEVTWSQVLRMLSCWAQQDLFKTSIEQMTRIYTMLGTALKCEQGAADAICDAFSQSPLIWLPAKVPLTDNSNTTAAAPFLLRGLPFDMTPQPQSTQNRRRHHRKVAFTTPGIQAQRPPTDTPAAPAYTPYTLTPGSKAPALHRPTLGQFHAASGDTLRLWDSTDVLESLPADKLSIRILSAIYSDDAVMQFFAEGLIRRQTLQSSPIRQFEGLCAIRGAAPVQPSPAPLRQPSPQAQQQQQQPQQQQRQQLQQQQQQLPRPSSPPRSHPLPAAATVLTAKPARVALEDYIDLVSSDEEAEMAAAEQSEPQPADAAHATAAVDMDQDLPAPPQEGEAAATADAQAASAVTEMDADSTAQHPKREAASSVDAQATTSADPVGQTRDARPAQTVAAPAAASTQAEAAAQSDPASTPAPPPAARLEPAPLILAEPTCQEYCKALAALAEPLPPALYPMQLTKVLAILNRWSRMVADNSLEDWEVSQLQSMLKNVKAFPIAGQQWASLADGLILNDEPNLARLFEGAHGVALLHLPQGSERYVPLHA